MDKHHLKPKHRGGTDDDGLVEVTKTCHAMFHFCEFQLHGMKEDFVAWKALAGQMNKGEIAQRIWKGQNLLFESWLCLAWEAGSVSAVQRAASVAEAPGSKTGISPEDMGYL